ncbi:MAG: hypothetical protein M3Q72_02445, partial [Actinomycetota bacterium]|nr:hypothetical protein [Actinomycetota bacterium]
MPRPTRSRPDLVEIIETCGDIEVAARGAGLGAGRVGDPFRRRAGTDEIGDRQCLSAAQGSELDRFTT